MSSPTRPLVFVLILIGCLTLRSNLFAGEIRLKNGTILRGNPVPVQSLNTVVRSRSSGPITIYPMLMVDEEGVVRVFVPARQVDEINRDVDLGGDERFSLPQRRPPRSQVVQSVGAIFDATPFDAFGRRLVTLKTGAKDLNVMQGVTDLNPRYVHVRGLSHQWEFGIPTTSLPLDTLDAMLRKATTASNPDDRLAIARFYLEAGLYFPAQAELGSIRNDFPELKDKIDELSLALTQQQAQQFLDEIRLRRAAGQHQLSYEKTRVFPVENISGSILRDVRELLVEHETATEKIRSIRDQLGILQASLPPDVAAEVAPRRSEISEQLGIDTLDRMAAYLNLAQADNLDAKEKLALALSGWVLGSANATTELDAALNLWKARFLIQLYLKEASSTERDALIGRIGEIEGVGPTQVAEMLPLLPPRYETGHLTPGVDHLIEIPAPAETPVRYGVILPPEYDVNRSYPMIVSLHPQGRTYKDALHWWGGTESNPGHSQRNGYIVIAPDYAPEGMRSYDYSPTLHQNILDAIFDARKRFHVDSDRVYFSGHGMGGDAAFDFAFAHPDLFAGVIPIAGVSDKFCKFYWQNGKMVPFFIINGELDRDTIATNSRDLTRMMSYGFDVIYAEHVGYGYDHFYSDITRLFDWMPRHRRTKYPKVIDVKTLRTPDSQFWWWQFAGFPANNTLTAWPDERTRISPLICSAKITPGNSVILQCGANRHALWLTPDLIDFDRRVTVKLNGAQKFNDFLKPEIAAMLDDFRVRGDRQKITWARIDF